jgi:hypothetical protein
MIIEGNQRGNAKQLANHLLNDRDNDHVTIHEVTGFSSETVHGAFQEIQATSRATRCKQFLFSASLNPPQNEVASIETFEKALTDIEQKMGLKGQPRVVVFHEKEGRRHAHCVWSRIDAQSMTAINLPFYKKKLNEISKDIYLEQGWNMPKGFIDKQYANPLNFTREEWQQAKRQDDDPRMIKHIFKQAWGASDDGKAFAHALQNHGFTLAKGDRRGFVAVDYKGEVYSLSRWTGLKTRALNARLKQEDLPSVQQAKTKIAEIMTDVLQKHINDVRNERSKKYQPLKSALSSLRERHRSERTSLEKTHNERQIHEDTQRQDRMPRWFKSVLARITGKHRRIQEENRQDALKCQARDQKEKQELITKQLQERSRLQDHVQKLRNEHNETMLQMCKDIGTYMEMKERNSPEPVQFKPQQQEHGGYSME